MTQNLNIFPMYYFLFSIPYIHWLVYSVVVIQSARLFAPHSFTLFIFYSFLPSLLAHHAPPPTFSHSLIISLPTHSFTGPPIPSSPSPLPPPSLLHPATSICSLVRSLRSLSRSLYSLPPFLPSHFLPLTPLTRSLSSLSLPPSFEQSLIHSRSTYCI